MYQRDADIKRAERSYDLAYDICNESERDKLAQAWKGPDKGWETPPGGWSKSDCTAEAGKSWNVALKGSWGNVAITALVPIPLGWLLVHALIGIVRWIRRGFNSG